MGKYLKFAPIYFRKKWPVEVTFFVTSRCNFRCSHCFNWKKIEGKKQDELTIWEIEKITKSMPKMLRLLVSGGEPFLRDDLPQICESFYRNCNVVHITIPTNASMPNRIYEKTKQILKLCPDAYVNVSVSVDGRGTKRDKMVNVKNSHKTLEETCEKLYELKKYKNFALTSITTTTSENQKDLSEILGYALIILGVDNTAQSLVRGDTKNKKVKNINITEYNIASHGFNMLTMDFPMAKMFKNKKKILSKIVTKTFKENKYQIPCYSGKIRGVISETGDVYPCETLMYGKDSNNFRFGNLRHYNYDFKKLWTSWRAKDIREWIKKTKCFCRHECDLTTNILFNPRFLWRLLK